MKRTKTHEVKSAYQRSETSFRFCSFFPHVPGAPTTLVGEFDLISFVFFVLFRRLCYFGHNIFHGIMEPDGRTVWSIIGFRKYMLHLLPVWSVLRVWPGRNPTNTLRGLSSTSENICCICFVFGLVCACAHNASETVEEGLLSHVRRN